MSTFPTVHRRLAAALVSLALLGGVAACADDDDAATGSTTTEAASGTTTTSQIPSDGTTAGEATGGDGDATTATPPDDGDTTTSAADPASVEDEPLDPDVQAYVDATVGTFEDGGDVVMRASGECLVRRWVSLIGIDRLQEAGVTPEEFDTASEEVMQELDLDERTANELVDSIGDCGVDLRAMYETGMRGPATPAQRRCLDELLTEENLRRSMVASLLGEELEDDPVDDAFTCIYPEIPRNP